MNKIFKVIWSKTKGCYIVVSEIAKNQSKSGKRRARDLALAAIVGVGVVASNGVSAAPVDDTGDTWIQLNQNVSNMQNQILTLNNWKDSVTQNGGISGGTGVDLSEYATVEYVDNSINAVNNSINALTAPDGAITAAQTAANNAQTAANDAQTAANNAASAAATAQSTADTAVANAATAQSAAEAAQADATRALADAAAANTAAGQALIDAKAYTDEKVGAEVTARTNADNTLQTNINNEATARTNADNTLQTNIDSEVTRAQGAEGALDVRLQTVETKTTAIGYVEGRTVVGGTLVVASGTEEDAKRVSIANGTISGLTNTDWVTNAALDGSNVAATQGQLYDIASKGFQVKTDNGTFNAPLASEISIVGDGKNISTASATGSRNLTISMKDDPTFREVTSSVSGGTTYTKMDNTGFYVTPSTGTGSASTVSLTSSGLNNGRNQLKNIADGTDYTDAVTYKQLIAERIKIQGAGDAVVTFAPIVTEGTDIIEGTMYTITVNDRDTKPAGDGLTTSVTDGNVVSVRLAKAADGSDGSIIATEGANGGLTLNPVLTLGGGAQSLTFDAPSGHIDGLTNITWYRPLVEKQIPVIDPETGEQAVDDDNNPIYKTELIPEGYVPNRAATEGQIKDVVDKGWTLGADNASKTLALNKTANIIGGNNIQTTIAEADANGNLNLTVSTTQDVLFNTVNVKNLDPQTGLPIAGTNTVSIDSQYVYGLKNTSFFVNNPLNTVVKGNDTSANYLAAGNLPENVATSNKAATEAQLFDVVTGLNAADRYITKASTETNSTGTTVTLTQNNANNIVFTIPPTTGGGGGTGSLVPHPDDDNHPLNKPSNNARGDGNEYNWYIQDGDTVYENTTLATMDSTREGAKSSVTAITGAIDGMADSTRDQVTNKITSMADATTGQVTYGHDYVIMDTAGNAIQLSDLASANVLETVHGVVLNHDGRIRAVEDGFKLKAGTETPHEGDVKPGETLEFTGNVTSTNANIKIDYEKSSETSNVDKIDISVVDDPKFASVEVGTVGGKKAIIDSNGVSFDGNYYIGPNGLDGNGRTISRVGNGSITSTSMDAINGSQLYPVKRAVEQGFTVNGYTVSLIGEGVEGFNIAGGKNIDVTTNGSTISVKTVDTPEFTAVTVGTVTRDSSGKLTSTPILINEGDQGTIRNLQNKTWNLGQSVPYSGQAATEDQLAIIDTGLTNLGMNFKGDDAAVVHKNLGETLNIVGGASTSTEQDNIYVQYIENNGNPYLKVNLAKNVDLTMDGSIIVNNVTLDKDGLSVSNGANDGQDQQIANYDESGMTIIRPKNDSRHDLAFTDEEISAGDNVITNVGSGLTLAPGQTTPNQNNAATVGDVMKLATNAEGDKNITVNMVDDTEVPGKKNAEISLNPTVKLGEDDKEQIVLNGTTGNATIGKVTVNGAAGTITGLTNTTYAVQSKPGKGSGQAATVGQIYDVVDKTNGGWGLTADSGSATKQDIGKTLAVTGGTVNNNKNIETKTTANGVEINLKNIIELANSSNTDMVTLNGNTGEIVAGSGNEYKVSINGGTGVITAGQKVTLNGAQGTGNIGSIQFNSPAATNSTITGLSNKTWNPNSYVSGQAATEDQLKAYGDADTDWQLVANPAGGNYKVEASKVTLKVEDKNHAGTYNDVVIEDIASASNNVTNVSKNQAGDTITITQTINGTPNTVEFKNTNDYVVAGEYDIAENGSVTLARKDVNGADLVGVVIKDVAKASDLKEVADNYVKNVTVNGNSMTINKVVGGEDADPLTFTNTNDYVVAGTYEVTENGTVTLARKDADGKDIAGVTITGIASSTDLENATIAYKANGQNGQTVKLSDGFDFTSGDNTVATVAADGVVTFDLATNIDLGDDGSITIGGTEIKDESVTVGDTTITGDQIQVGGQGGTTITDDSVKVGDITIDGAKDEITIGDTTIKDGEISVGDTTITGDTISTTNIKLGDSETLVTIKQGDKDLSGQTINRIWYGDRQVATMGDGLKFSADEGNPVSKKLNEELPINGDDNITTKTTADGGIQVTLNKEIDLGDKGSITIGDTTIDGDSVTTNEVNVGDTTIDEDGVTTNNITVEGDTTNTVIDGDKITVGDNTTIEDGKITVGDTIIEGDKITTEEIVIGGNSLLIEGSDIKTVYGDTINRIKYTDAQGNEQEVATMNDGLKFRADDKEVIINRKHNETLAIVGDGSVVTTADPDSGEIKVGLADKITVGTGDNKVEIDGTKGTITTGDVTIDGAKNEISVGDGTTIGDGTATFGDVTINEGDKGTINNLTNIEWGDNYTMVSGQAATEDQLKAVEDGIVEKGLNFAGDRGDDSHRNLGEKVNIIGGADADATLTEGNIGVTSDGKGTLTVQLNSKLSGLEEIQVGENTKIEDNKITVGDIVIDGENKEITVGDNTTIGDGEATIGDINIDGNNKEITVGDNTTIGDGEATIGGVNIDGTNNTVTVGNEDNKVEINGDNGTITTGDVTIDGANNQITVGDNTTIEDGKVTVGDVVIDGDKNTVNNLSNKTFDINNIVSGQAATEDQLKQAVEDIQEAGMNFVGDDNKEIHKNLGETLSINGDKTNIHVTNKEDGLVVELDKDLKVDSVDVGDGATVLNKDGSASIAGGNFNIAANGDIDSKYDGGTIKADGNGFEITHGDSSLKVDEAGTTFANGDGSGSTIINGDTINAGDNITIDGGEGVVTIKGEDGTKADISVGAGSDVNGTADKRITIDGTNVATVNDGMIFSADEGADVVKKLNDTLPINGDENITTKTNRDGIQVTLNKKLQNLEEVQVGDVVINETSVNIGDTKVEDGKVTVGDTIIDKTSVTTETINAADVNADRVTVKETVKVGDKTEITGDTVTTETVKTGDTTINNNGMTVKDGPTVTKDKVDVNGNKIENVAPGTLAKDSMDAVNGSQLYETNRIINKLGNRVNRVGARSAALAALHPMDFDPDDKLTFAAGYGNYKGENAAAIGAFYRPDEKVMFSLAGTVSNDDNMINAGVSFSLDRTPHQTNSKTAMARDILDLTAKVNLLLQENDRMKNALREATKNGGRVSIEFPDLPKDHWAYMYVQELAELGYLIGYPDGMYKGDRTLTRYEFATALYRALMNGAPVDDKMGRGMDEFKNELDNVAKAARFRVDRIAGQDDDRNKIERVRTNHEGDENIPDYRDVYGSKIAPPAKK